MKKIASILIISLVISLILVTAKTSAAAAQSNQQTTITLYEAGNNLVKEKMIIKGTELTPDCEYPWTVQKFNISAGMQVIEVNNGKLSFQINPSRGMAIQEAIIGNQSPIWKSPVIDNNPASLVELIIDRSKPYKITIRGKAAKGSGNEQKPQIITEISTVPGSSTFQMSNTIDFAALETITSVSAKPAITLAEVIKSAKTWEPSFKEWFGKPAPDFTITDITGKQHKVSDYRGKNLIINVWATWCPPCKKEIPDFIELRKTVSEDELAILGISTETGKENTVKQFVSQNKMNYTILVADPLKLAAPYSKISAIPTTFFIDPEGKIKIATIGVLTLKDIKDILHAQK
ncbi:MAG: redoxin domain-containing protein [Sedimentisphaerales bacterium]|nr:redoxin domain-containing protein [Sedimentisphaerales bacterium]